MKRRIAILIHGGVGTGNFAQGYPLLGKLLSGIATDFDIHVFSHATPEPGFVPEILFWSPGRGVRGNMWRWWLLIKEVRNVHRQNKFDLILAFWGYPAGVVSVVLGKTLGLPVVVYLLGGDSTGIKSIDYGVMHKPIQYRIVQWAYRRATKILVLSHYQVQELTRFGFRLEPVVIPWGVDLTVYKFEPRRCTETLEIIHVGHLSAVKDQQTLLKAFALIRAKYPARLSIYGGDAGCSGQLHRLCEDLGITSSVIFNQMVPYPQMPEHYSSAQLMIHTSLSEGQSLAVTEAAASGIVVAGTTTGLLYDLDDSQAIRVAVGDYDELASKVLALISAPGEWDKKAQHARRWCEAHSLDWSINRINTELRSIVS